MASERKGALTDEEIYMLASEHEYEHGTDMFGFARALLAEAGERLMQTHDSNFVFKYEVRRILGVRENR